jgi:hypothetical protein
VDERRGRVTGNAAHDWVRAEGLARARGDCLPERLIVEGLGQHRDGPLGKGLSPEEIVAVGG